MLLETLVGLLGAAILIYFSFNWPLQKQLKLWSTGLLIVALIYIGFVCYQVAWNYLPQELLGVLGYGTLGFLGYRYRPELLIMGWTLHVFWDVLLHSTSSIAPDHYPGFCIGFDLTIALYLIYLLWNKPHLRKTKSVSRS